MKISINKAVKCPKAPRIAKNFAQRLDLALKQHVVRIQGLFGALNLKIGPKDTSDAMY